VEAAYGQDRRTAAEVVEAREGVYGLYGSTAPTRVESACLVSEAEGIVRALASVQALARGIMKGEEMDGRAWQAGCRAYADASSYG